MLPEPKLVRRTPKVRANEIEVAKGKRERIRISPTLFLDDLEHIYKQIDSVCGEVEVSTETYASMPFATWSDVRDEQFDWLEIFAFEPMFNFRTEKGDGVTIMTFDNDPGSEALFSSIVDYCNERGTPKTRVAMFLTSVFGILNGFGIMVMAFIVLGYVFGLTLNREWISGGQFAYIRDALIFLAAVVVVGITLSLKRWQSNSIGNVIWYYRRDYPKSHTDRAMVIATILSAVFSSFVTAVVTWIIATRGE